MGDGHGPQGWAFLVGRGRHRGYRSILAPDFLIETNEYGRLPDLASSGGGPGPTVTQMRSTVGDDLAVVYQTGQLTYRDVPADAVSGTGEPGRSPDEPFTDEHGRGIRVAYGFITRGTRVSGVSEADLEEARVEGMRAYGRFLADESHFTVDASLPYSLQSAVVDRDPRPLELTDRGSLVVEAPARWPTTRAGGRAERPVPARAARESRGPLYMKPTGWAGIAVGLVALVLAVALLARPSGDVATLGVSATDVAFTPTELRAKAGDVEISLRNTGEESHDFTIEGRDGEKLTAAKGETATRRFSLAKGRYTFFCSVGDHRDRGMAGTLVVE